MLALPKPLTSVPNQRFGKKNLPTRQRARLARLAIASSKYSPRVPVALASAAQARASERQIGTFSDHFWMPDMKSLRRRRGNQHLHRAPLDYRNDVRRKLHAYHVFIQAGIVCQGLLHYLAVACRTR